MKCNIRKATILPFAMMAIIILIFIGLALIRLGTSARVMAAHEVAQMSARAAADTGLIRAVKIMNDQITNKTLDKNNLPSQATPVYLPAAFGNAHYTYQATYDTPTDSYRVASTGTAGHRTKTVNTILGIKSAFVGIGAEEGIDVKSSITFSTIPSDAYFAIMTNSTTPPPAGGISLKSSVTVPGDVVVGPGSDPDEVVDTKSDTIVEGDTYAGPGFEMPPVVVPAHLVSAASEGSKTGAAINITSSGKIDSIDLDNSGTLTIGGGATTKIELYVTGTVRLRQSAKIIITSGHSVDIYLGNNFIGDNNSDIINENPTTTDAQKEFAAESFKLYGLPTCTSIDLKSQSDFYGMIYAPNASLTLFNGGDIYGALAVHDLEIKNSGNFIYVASLYDLDPGDQGVYFAVDRWWED